MREWHVGIALALAGTSCRGAPAEAPSTPPSAARRTSPDPATSAGTEQTADGGSAVSTPWSCFDIDYHHQWDEVRCFESHGLCEIVREDWASPPHGAPKLYDLSACHDHAEVWTYLVQGTSGDGRRFYAVDRAGCDAATRHFIEVGAVVLKACRPTRVTSWAPDIAARVGPLVMSEHIEPEHAYSMLEPKVRAVLACVKPSDSESRVQLEVRPDGTLRITVTQVDDGACIDRALAGAALTDGTSKGSIEIRIDRAR